MLNDSRQAVRDFKMTTDDHDNIYDIIDPHNARKCLEESKQSKVSQDALSSTRQKFSHQHPNSSSGAGYGPLSHSGKLGKEQQNRSYEIDQNDLMKAMNYCETK